MAMPTGWRSVLQGLLAGRNAPQHAPPPEDIWAYHGLERYWISCGCRCTDHAAGQHPGPIAGCPDCGCPATAHAHGLCPLPTVTAPTVQATGSLFIAGGNITSMCMPMLSSAWAPAGGFGVTSVGIAPQQTAPLHRKPKPPANPVRVAKPIGKRRIALDVCPSCQVAPCACAVASGDA